MQKSNNAFIRDRTKIILLSSQRLSPKQISEKINCGVRKVRQAIKDFNQRGVDALQRGKSKGTPPKFTEATKKVILMHFAKQPKDFDLYITAWTLPRLRKHLMEYNVVNSISIETLRQILSQAGAKLERSKRWEYSPDPEFDKKNLQ